MYRLEETKMPSIATSEFICSLSSCMVSYLVTEQILSRLDQKDDAHKNGARIHCFDKEKL